MVIIKVMVMVMVAVMVTVMVMVTMIVCVVCVMGWLEQDVQGNRFQRNMRRQQIMSLFFANCYPSNVVPQQNFRCGDLQNFPCSRIFQSLLLFGPCILCSPLQH